jgi:uncharacterized protein YndB with AHSA1/START domain
MDSFRVESVHLETTPEKAFRYVADPRNLPNWTHAFKSVRNGKATMVTPAGAVEIGLEVRASVSEGTIDWHMTFPDGAVASAYSRLLPDSNGQSIYSFVLTPPPVPLEQLEGALDQQACILKQELTKLRAILSEA